MKLTATEGCTCYHYEIDDISIDKLLDTESEYYNPDKVREAIIKMINLPEAQRVLEYTYQSLITQLGNEKYEFHCDDCGDSVYSYKLCLK